MVTFKKPDIENFYRTFNVQTFAVSPDEKQVVFSTNLTGKYNLWGMDLPNHYPYPLTFIDQNCHALSYSHDGRFMVAAFDHDGDENTQLYALPPAGGELVPLRVEEGQRHMMPVLSKDDQRLYYTSTKNNETFLNIYCYDLEKDEETLVIEGDGAASFLVSMVSEKDERNHAHGIKLEILKLQAEALGIPLMLVDSAGDYECSLATALTDLKQQHGVDEIVFGSLYSEEDRKWNEEVAYKAGMEPLFPVWIPHSESKELLDEFISLGFSAVVCRASEKHFDQTWAGRLLDRSFYEDIQQYDVCPMGEFGEYHTFVLDGPIFQKRVSLIKSGVVLNSGLWSLDVQECQLVDKVIKS